MLPSFLIHYKPIFLAEDRFNFNKHREIIKFPFILTYSNRKTDVSTLI